MPHSSQQEEWCPIEGAPNYEVSSAGRVRRTTARTNAKAGHVLATKHDDLGYVIVRYYVDGKVRPRRIHQLVAAAFLGPRPSPKHVVAHADGNGRNNNVGNLRWATPAENAADTVRHGRTVRGARSQWAKLTEAQVVEIIRRRKAGERTADLAALYRVTAAAISKITTGVSWAWLPR